MRFHPHRLIAAAFLLAVSLVVSPTGSQAAEPTGQGAAKAKQAAPTEWRPLFDGRTLTNWKVTDFAGHNQVEVKEGTIVMLKGSKMTGITWTGEYPKIDYEISLEAQRVEGRDFFCGLTFPVEDAPCSLIVGGWGGGVVGLSSINGLDASENDTTQYVEFASGRWYPVRLRVTKAKIEAWIDGKKLVDEPTQGRTFSVRLEIAKSQPLGIACWDTTAALRDIKLRKLSPREVDSKQKSGR